MDRAVVTGGAGFIGSHLVDWLINMGVEVLVVDNLSTGMEDNINPAAVFEHTDLTNAHHVKEAVGFFKPSVVFHLAAQANVPRSVDIPRADAMSNIIGSINLFEACKVNDVDKVVYASTGGGIYAGAYDEDYSGFCERTPELPKSPYGVSKLSVEKYLKGVYSPHFKHTTLRLPNVYGTRRNPNSGAGVVSIFSRNIVEGKPCYMYGGGELGRDYVHVSDVVVAFWLAATRRTGALYNIGSNTIVAVADIADILDAHCREKGYTPEFIKAQIREGEAVVIRIDANKFTEQVGWEPTVEIEKGIHSTFDWIEECYHDSGQSTL